MSAPSPSRLLDAVQASGVDYQLAAGWDKASNAAGGTWSPRYVILHHTANGGAKGDAPSLGYVTTGNPYAPVRACHFLIARSGLVHVVMAHKAYHAGEGGPGKWGNGPSVPGDSMNGYGYGIEIESKGTSLDPAGSGGTNGITAEQYDATARLTAALLELIGSNVKCAINHRTWAPGRKTDTLVDDGEWHDLIEAASTGTPAPPMGEDDGVIIIRTNDGNGAHYLIAGSVASPLPAGYVRPTDFPTITLPKGDNGKAFLKPYGIK